MSNRRGPLNSDVENVSKQIFDECLDEIVLGVAFDIHRSVKTGLFAVIEPESPNKKGTPMEVGNSGYATDVFGQVITTMVGVPALKKQPECRCPQCDRNLAASRFAPHLEKCMGMGRNSRLVFLSSYYLKKYKAFQTCPYTEKALCYSENISYIIYSNLRYQIQKSR